jgi:hypothetical protein
MANRKTLAAIFILMLVSGAALGQIVINAMVADSATLKPLSDVNVKLKNSLRGTTTSQAGYFILNSEENDTLVFTRVGYLEKQVSALRLKETMIVYLTEESILLKPVEIRANILIPNIQEMAEQTPREPSDDKIKAVTGFQGLETFGPGMVARGAFSRFSKEEREKKKLKTVQEDNRKGKGYIDVINDPEVKDRIMKEHNLTEEKFYELLAKFNERNKEIMYEMEAEDLIAYLDLFFKEHAKK